MPHANASLPVRPLLALLALLLSAPAVAADRYEEHRTLSLDATGIRIVDIEVGAGALEVTGDETASEIRLDAVLWIEDAPQDPERVRKALARHVEVSLERDGDRARVVTVTDDPGIGYTLPHVDVRLVVPHSVSLGLTDRSGWIRVSRIAGNVEIRDGAGSITLAEIGGHVAIDDDSGSIDVTGVAGRLGIEDGSGSIGVQDVEGDLAIDDGSGSITVRNVAGSVTIRDGSGSILVAGVGHDLHVLEAGSGAVSFSDVRGEITVDD
jgi:hypothetical protein